MSGFFFDRQVIALPAYGHYLILRKAFQVFPEYFDMCVYLFVGIGVGFPEALFDFSATHAPAFLSEQEAKQGEV